MEKEKQIRINPKWEDSNDLDSPNNISAEEIALLRQQVEADDQICEFERPAIKNLRIAIRRQRMVNIVQTIKSGILWLIKRFCRLFSNRLRIIV